MLGTGIAAVPSLASGAAALKAALGTGWGAMGTGASFSGVMYSGAVAVDTYKEDGQGNSFADLYWDNFSGAKFAFSVSAGAVGGLSTWQMLRWAGVPTGLIPSLKTAEGVVIRANNGVQGAAVSRAGQAMIDHYENKESREDDRLDGGAP